MPQGFNFYQGGHSPNISDQGEVAARMSLGQQVQPLAQQILQELQHRRDAEQRVLLQDRAIAAERQNLEAQISAQLQMRQMIEQGDMAAGQQKQQQEKQRTVDV